MWRRRLGGRCRGVRVARRIGLSDNGLVGSRRISFASGSSFMTVCQTLWYRLRVMGTMISWRVCRWDSFSRMMIHNWRDVITGTGRSRWVASVRIDYWCWMESARNVSVVTKFGTWAVVCNIGWRRVREDLERVLGRLVVTIK